MHIQFRKQVGFTGLALGVGLAIALAPLHFWPPSTASVQAQPSRIYAVASQVYDRLPALPRENQYIRQNKTETDNESTLISRLIRYHTTVKSRAPNYRLDWKLTLADYMGVNDYLLEDLYPGHGFLAKSAMAGDIAAIQKLNRVQRAALVQTLVDIYTGRPSPEAKLASEEAPADSLEQKPSAPATPSVPQPQQRPRLTPLPTPGGANLLLSPQPESSPQPPGDSRLLLPQ